METGREKGNLGKEKESVLLGSSILCLILFPPSHFKDKIIYCRHYKGWTVACSVSDFWASDMVFSLKTGKAIFVC